MVNINFYSIMLCFGQSYWIGTEEVWGIISLGKISASRLTPCLFPMKSKENQALMACCAEFSFCSSSHGAPGNGLPSKRLSHVFVSVCWFLSFWNMTVPKWKDSSTPIKTFFLLSEFCLFSGNPLTACALCAVVHFPLLCAVANLNLWRLLCSIAWSKYHSSIAI